MSSNKHQLVAIIYDKKGNKLSQGKNSYKKSHPLQALYCGPKKRFFHAEIAALVKLPYGKTPYRIFVARLDKRGNPRCAKPCSGCQRAIRDFGIKVVEHT